MFGRLLLFYTSVGKLAHCGFNSSEMAANEKTENCNRKDFIVIHIFIVVRCMDEFCVLLCFVLYCIVLQCILLLSSVQTDSDAIAIAIIIILGCCFPSCCCSILLISIEHCKLFSILMHFNSILLCVVHDSLLKCIDFYAFDLSSVREYIWISVENIQTKSVRCISSIFHERQGEKHSPILSLTSTF